MKRLLFFGLMTLAALPAKAQQPIVPEPEPGQNYYPAYSYNPNYKGFHLGFYSGMWFPNGRLSLLGNHPYAGVQLGFANRNLMLSLSVAARFLKSANTFTTKKDDSLYASRHYSAGYFGVDGSYNLYKKGRHEWDAEAGAGVEAILAFSVKRPGDENKTTHSLYSPNINMGIGYKYWFKGAYIGLDLKYNLLFFSNEDATDFTGNAITIGLCFGGIAIP